MVFDEYGPARMIRSHEWKYVHRWPDGPHELYHLAEDPGESVNLVADPALQPLRRQLAAELSDWFQRHVRPATDGEQLPVIGTGQAALVGDAHAFGGPLWDSTAGDNTTS